MRSITAVSLAAVFSLLNGQAQAQGTYPNKPIRWIIPYAAGGGTDVVARPLAIKQMVGEG